MAYFEELQSAMSWLGEEGTYFIGQSVSVPGTAMYNIKQLQKKKIRTPVFEDTQMGMSLGMAMVGTRVISIFP